MFGAINDGRFLTDYRPRCVVDNQIKKEYGITDSNSYRMFLQHNATELLQQQFDYDVNQLHQFESPICACSECTGATTALARTTTPATTMDTVWEFIKSVLSWRPY